MKSLIFSNQHVEAILAGRKTMTRRLVKYRWLTTFPDWKWRPDEARFVADEYARPGDRIVVRESFWKSSDGRALFRKPPYAGPACSPIHLPWAQSRCTIEVVSCRVERLLDMPFRDVAKEGYPQLLFRSSFFEFVWDELNPKAKAASNPWVYVLEFKVAEKAE